MEKLRDYSSGSKFIVYTNSNPLAYVQESKLGVAQSRWLSEVALPDLYIKYLTGKSNKTPDTLIQSDNEESSDASSKEYETISHATACEDITNVINGDKMPTELKHRTNNEVEIKKVSDMSEVIVFNNI